jgi:hypothetical protein
MKLTVLKMKIRNMALYKYNYFEFGMSLLHR